MAQTRSTLGYVLQFLVTFVYHQINFNDKFINSIPQTQQTESPTQTAQPENDQANSSDAQGNAQDDVQEAQDNVDNNADNSTDNNQTQISQNNKVNLNATQATDTYLLQKQTLPVSRPDIEPLEKHRADFIDAIQALYQSGDTPLTSTQMNTLINIGTLTPEVFDEPELATRLYQRLPALTRLLRKNQIARELEAKQQAQLEQLQAEQVQANIEKQKELDAIAEEFREVISQYDEQIAKYEKALKEFE